MHDIARFLLAFSLALLLVACGGPPPAPTPQPTPDTTKPTVTMDDPGPLLAGQTTTLTGSASDDVGVSKVEVYEGATLLGEATLTNGTWSYAYAAQTPADVTLKAVARDAAGNESEASRVVSVTSAWIVQFGTSGDDRASGVAIASDGSIYVVGNTKDVFPGATSTGSRDAFLAKYDANGTQVWVRQFGTVDEDHAIGVATASDGSIYVVGNTRGAFPGATYAGSGDAFLAKYDANGTQAWVRQFSTSGVDEAESVAVAPDGSVYIAGDTSGTFPGATSMGDYDAFLAKYDPNGNEVWLTQFGTSERDGAKSVAAAPDGSVYVAGYTGGAFPGATIVGGRDAFLAKYDANGNEVWLTQSGASGDDIAESVAVAPDGSVYVAGGTFGAATSAGSRDAFLAKYDANGTQAWVRQVGTSGYDDAESVAAAPDSSVYVAGHTEGAFPGATNMGSYDGFLGQYDTNGNEVWLTQFGTSGEDAISGVAVGASGGLYHVGSTEGSFGGQSAGGRDVFLSWLYESAIPR